MRELTILQANVLRYIIDYTLENLFQPSWREIAYKFDMDSTNQVTTVIDALIKKKYLKKHEERRTPRALEITDKALREFAKNSTTTWSHVIKHLLDLRGIIEVANAPSSTQ